MATAPPEPVSASLPPSPVAGTLPAEPAQFTPAVSAEPPQVGQTAPAVPAQFSRAAQAVPAHVAGLPRSIPACTAPPHAAPPPGPQPKDDGEPVIDLAAEADRYAITYPRRAQLIRRLGGVPEDCDFGPPEPDLAHAIAGGTSPALRAPDGAGDAAD